MKEYRKDQLTIEDIAYMMDPSVLKIDSTPEDVKEMIALCKRCHFGTAFCWPCNYLLLSEGLKDTKTVFGTSLAFPSGQESTKTKVYLAKEFDTMNPGEHDMVMNVGWLRSGRYADVLADIKAVREAVPDKSLKVIIEAMCLTDDEIRKACDLCMEGGANYVKTGTGFQQKPTTLHHVQVIKEHVGDRIKIKVAGGVRDLDIMLRMYKAGANRFGIGVQSAEKIYLEAVERCKNGPIDLSTVSLEASQTDTETTGLY